MIVNGTWELVPYPFDTDPIGNKLVFRTKLLHNGFLDKYKARVIAKRYDQVEGITYSKIFSHVVKLQTI